MYKNIIDLYYRDIRKYNVLSLDEEVSLFKELNNTQLPSERKDKIIETIMLSNQRFVISIAKKMPENMVVSLFDFISEGNIGLRNAIDRYDYSMGYRFISYAVWWIKQSIFKLLNDSNIINNQTQSNLNNKENKLKEKLNNLINKSLGLNEYQELISIEKELNKIHNDKESLSPIYFSDSFDDSGITIEDILKSDSENPEDITINKESAYFININILDLLDRDIDKRVLIKFFGLNGNEPMSLKDIGISENMRREQIRQIYSKCINILKKKLKTQNYL